MRAVERAVMLSIIDVRWKDHLLDMDYLQEGIHLRALGQRDPLSEYKTEGFDLFEDMLDGVRQSVVTTLMKNSPEDLAYFAAMTFDQPHAGAQLHERRRPRLPDLVRRRRDRGRRPPRQRASDERLHARRPRPRARRRWRPSRTPVAVQQRHRRSRSSAATTPAGAGAARSSRSVMEPRRSPSGS